jgi:2-keto-4-pentenoate hydratase
MDHQQESAIPGFVREMLTIFREHRLERQTNVDLGNLTLPEAYKIQDQVLAARVANGERIVGWKVGCTSRAIQQQFGLSQPISGRLLEPQIYPDGDTLRASQYVDCAVEPEMVFRLGKDIDGETDDRTLVRSIAGVRAGIELHNYRFWYGTPTSQELIASNGIHAGLVCGPEMPLDPSFDLSLEGVGVFVNGTLKASGIGAEIMGGPLDSLRWLARHAAERGQSLRAGELIIPGSAVQLVRVQAGDFIEARFTRIGACRCRLA